VPNGVVGAAGSVMPVVGSLTVVPELELRMRSAGVASGALGSR